MIEASNEKVVDDILFIKPKVLLIDAVDLSRQMIRQVFSYINVEIVEAVSAKEALQHVLHDDFAVILMDVNMLDVLNVLKVLNETQESKHISIILTVDDFCNEEHYFLSYENGTVDFLYKPLNAGILLNKVKHFIDLYKSKCQLESISSRYELILNSAGEGILGVSSEGVVTFCNPSSTQIFKKYLVGESFVNFLYDDKLNELHHSIKYEITNAIKQKMDFKSDKFFIRTPNGIFVPISFSITPAIKNISDDIAVVVVFSDITNSKYLEKKLSKLACFDSLTGLQNRASFFDNLNTVISRAKRQKSRFSLFFIDIDNFKFINDTMGHAAGDIVLIEVAKRIKQLCRTEDTVSRIGGDEFTLIFENTNNYEDINKLANKILAISDDVFVINNKIIQITFSVGICVFPDGGHNKISLIRNADTAMYQAKENGKNKYQIFTQGLMEKMNKKAQLELRLRQALDLNEFELFYQPKINLETQKVNGLEALIRWNDPQNGYVYPNEFIPLVEENGLIIEIGEWVIEEAFRQKIIWDAQDFPSEITIAINVSACQLSKSDFFTTLINKMTPLSNDSIGIELEITETAIMQNVELVSNSLKKAHELGFTIAIDDFGMGYSSLSKLKLLPVDTLKIDHSFVRDIVDDVNDEAIVKAIINMAESLNLKVIAEGIETEEQLDMLLHHNCTEGQGFHFSKPLSAKEICKEMFV